jgi:hypothetical protein
VYSPAVGEEMIDSWWAECYASRPWWERDFVKQSKYRFPVTEFEIMQFDSKGTKKVVPPSHRNENDPGAG